jgi:hypothetical protein
VDEELLPLVDDVLVEDLPLPIRNLVTAAGALLSHCTLLGVGLGGALVGFGGAVVVLGELNRGGATLNGNSLPPSLM